MSDKPTLSERMEARSEERKALKAAKKQAKKDLKEVPNEIFFCPFKEGSWTLDPMARMCNERVCKIWDHDDEDCVVNSILKELRILNAKE